MGRILAVEITAKGGIAMTRSAGVVLDEETSSSSEFPSLQSVLQRMDESESDVDLVSTATKPLAPLFSVSSREEGENDVMSVYKGRKSNLNALHEKRQKLPFLSAEHMEDDVIVLSSNLLSRVKENDTSVSSGRTILSLTKPEAVLFALTGIVATLIFKRYRKGRKVEVAVRSPTGSSNQQTKSAAALSLSIVESPPPSVDENDVTKGRSRGNAVSVSHDPQLKAPVPKLCQEEGLRSVTMQSPESSRLTPVQIRVVRSPPNERVEEVTVSFPEGRQQTQRQMAKKLAEDTKFMKQVLEEEGLEPREAFKLAIALQQKMLTDENLSKRQHACMWTPHERSTPIKADSSPCVYDPNWKDKLRGRRDSCLNAAFRLVWDLALTQLLVKLSKILLPLFFSGDKSGSLSSASRLLQLVLTNLCDCEVPCGDDLKPSSIASSWHYFGGWGTLDYYFGHWESIVFVEQGACYGYCMITLGTVSVMAFALHQILRAFSAPVVFHHGTNAFAVSVLYGPSNPAVWIRRMWEAQPQLIALLLAGVVAMLAVVQWTYHSHRKTIAACPIIAFRQKWDRCLDAMDSLHFLISATRYGVLSMFAYVLWAHSTVNGRMAATDIMDASASSFEVHS